MIDLAHRKTRTLWTKMLGIYLGVALLALSFFAGAQIGFLRGKRAAVPPGEGQVLGTDSPPPAYLSRDVDFDLYWRVWNLLKDRYIKRPIGDTRLFYGSLRGMVDSLDDPYSAFLDPETTALFTQELEGKFEGIGAEIGIKNDVLTIIAPLPDTPAERAGLKAGDQILEIDGAATDRMTVEEAVTRIRGPRASQVTITVFREGFEAPQDFTIMRDEIIVKSVRAEVRPDRIAVIRLFQFGDDTEADFERAVLDLLTQNPRGIVLDLRNNPGGFLDAAVRVAGEWVPRPEVVVIEQDSTRTEFRSEGPARLRGIPTVVLVNGGSASGAEILAGALQDYKLGAVLGTQTFGKGSVQDFQLFPDGSAVKFTVAEWLTPLGRSISETGITPDEVVEITPEDLNAGRDPQLDRAVELLTQP